MFELGLCQALGLPSRQALYRTLTRTEYNDWAKYFRLTGFEYYPTRYAIAQLTHIFMQAHMEQGKKAPKVEELAFPRKPEPPKSEAEQTQELFAHLMTMVK